MAGTRPMKPMPFMSPQWRARAQALLQHMLDADPAAAGLRLCVVEHFRNLPPGAPLPVAGKASLCIIIDGGWAELLYGASEARDADLVIACDWEDAHRAACLTGASLERFNRWRIAEGRLEAQGSPGAAAALFHAIHEQMAPLTIPPEGWGATLEGEET